MLRSEMRDCVSRPTVVLTPSEPTLGSAQEDTTAAREKGVNIVKDPPAPVIFNYAIIPNNDVYDRISVCV